MKPAGTAAHPHTQCRCQCCSEQQDSLHQGIATAQPGRCMKFATGAHAPSERRSGGGGVASQRGRRRWLPQGAPGSDLPQRCRSVCAVVVAHRPGKRSAAIHIAGIQICALLRQRQRGVCVSKPRCAVQRCAAVVVDDINSNARPQQRPHYGCAASPRRPVQRALAIAGAGISCPPLAFNSASAASVWPPPAALCSGVSP